MREHAGFEGNAMRMRIQGINVAVAVDQEHPASMLVGGVENITAMRRKIREPTSSGCQTTIVRTVFERSSYRHATATLHFRCFHVDSIDVVVALSPQKSHHRHRLFASTRTINTGMKLCRTVETIPNVAEDGVVGNNLPCISILLMIGMRTTPRTSFDMIETNESVDCFDQASFSGTRASDNKQSDFKSAVFQAASISNLG